MTRILLTLSLAAATLAASTARAEPCDPTALAAIAAAEAQALLAEQRQATETNPALQLVATDLARAAAEQARTARALCASQTAADADAAADPFDASDPFDPAAVVVVAAEPDSPWCLVMGCE